jgi:uncharacterized membrane protein YbhN (UPF0104 family)
MGAGFARRLLIQFLVMLAFAALLFWRGDVGAALRTLHAADWRWTVPAAALVLLSKLVHGLRWWLLLRRVQPVPLRSAVLVLLAATGVSILLPFRAGAAVQVEVLHRRFGVDRTATAGTLIAEGILDAALLGMTLVAAVPLLAGRRAAIGAGGLLLAAGLVISLLLGLGRSRFWLRLLPRRLRDSAQAAVANLLLGTAAVWHAPTLLLLLVVTATDWTLAATAHWLAGRAVDLDLPAAAYLVVELVTNATGAVPLTQGNVGPYEFVVQEVVVAFGADIGHALAFAVTTHAVIIVAESIVGVAGVWSLRLPLEGMWRTGAPAASSKSHPC